MQHDSDIGQIAENLSLIVARATYFRWAEKRRLAPPVRSWTPRLRALPQLPQGPPGCPPAPG